MKRSKCALCAVIVVALIGGVAASVSADRKFTCQDKQDCDTDTFLCPKWRVVTVCWWDDELNRRECGPFEQSYTGICTNTVCKTKNVCDPMSHTHMIWVFGVSCG